MVDQKYIKDLEDSITKFLKPIEDIPFKIVVKSVYDNEVIPLNLDNEKDQILVEDLKDATIKAGKNARDEGIVRKRPNEVGNDMEDFVTRGLKEVNILADTPVCEDGRKRSTGYPDLFAEDKNGRPVYIEVKTFNRENINTSQRTFYMSPPKVGKAKITKDAKHIVISFEIKQKEYNDPNKNLYIPASWKIVSIYNMKINVKHEFNASNRELYKQERIIKEGKF